MYIGKLVDLSASSKSFLALPFVGSYFDNLQ